MTSVNIDRWSDVEARRRAHMNQAELEFWKGVAEDYRNRLDRIYDLATDQGGVTLVRGGEDEVVLVVAPLASP